MVTLKQIVVGAGIALTIAGGMYLNNQGTVIERNNLIYQGYHRNKADGINLLVFDDVPRVYRTDEPDLKVVGNPNGLKIGTEYDVKVKSPRWIGEDTLESIAPSD
ncbi:MAG: hypothetical protein ABIF18_04185 [archaeon]